MNEILLESVSKVINWLQHRKRKVVSLSVPKKSTCPIIEFYSKRSCPERERFNESLWSTGFIAADGILRVFYNENNVAVELEVNNVTIDLREIRPFPIHPKWILSKDLVHTWMRDHRVLLHSDFAWVSNVWT